MALHQLDQGQAMDLLIRVSQRSGQALGAIADAVVRTGSISGWAVPAAAVMFPLDPEQSGTKLVTSADPPRCPS